jgi:hypothetical protein
VTVSLPSLAAEEHVCTTCPLDYAAVEVGAIADRVRAVVRELRALVSDASDGALRRHPRDGVWSPLEYLCHVRDVYVSATIRLYRVRTEDAPQVEPMFNDLRTARFRHNEADPIAVLSELDLVVAGFADELSSVRDWDRTLTRLPGENRTARWLARQSLHEGLHHLHDIRAGLSAT